MQNNSLSPASEKIRIITRLRGTDKLLKNTKLLNLQDKITQELIEDLTKRSESKPQKSAFKLKDDIKYTMFSSGDSSNIMLVSQKPIKGSTINEALKVCDNLYEFHNSILNETSLLEYDKIYNEANSLEQIFNEVINDNITQLFHKKNTCVFCFGPTGSGKSYLLFGENADINNLTANKNNKYHYLNCKIEKKENKNDIKNKGLIKSSIYKILNLIKINKQGNDVKSSVKNKYEVRISIYQVYFDKIFDLLSRENKKIDMQTNYDENNILNTKLIGLTDAEIRNMQDYEKIIKEIEINRKNLAKNLKVKNINNNSNLVVSLKLRKKIQKRVGNNIIDNYSADYFSQIDFVELVQSEIGLNDKFKNANDLSFEYSLYENSKQVFDSIIDNISSANYGTTPNKESTLTLSLKNTLKTNSNIIFFNCVIPWEYPVNNSFKALKFTTWLRNQILNDRENINNDNINNNNLYNTINESNNIINNQFQNNSYYIENYKNPIAEDNLYIKYNSNQNSNINKSFPIINSNSISQLNNEIKEEENDLNLNIDEENKIKLKRNRSSNSFINKNLNKSYEIGRNKNINISNIIEYNNQNKNPFINENISQKDKTIQTLEQTLQELENKKLEIENKIYEDKMNINSSNDNNSNNIINKFQFSPKNVMSPEVLLMKEKQDILKSDNIIMKEDISRLSELNQNLENEVAQNRESISQLQSENQKLIEENLKLKTVLSDYDGNNYTKLYIGGQITKDEFLKKYFDEKYFLSNKIKELEKNMDILQKEKTQYQVDYQVLITKYDEIIKKYEKCNLELINTKQMHDNELYNIDNKINDLSKEVEKLQNENYELRREIETQRNSLNSVGKERDMIKDKYEEQKYENDLLNKKIFEVEKGYSDILREKEYEKYFKREKEENCKNKNETKNKIAQELHSKIQKYRRERLQKMDNNE